MWYILVLAIAAADIHPVLGFLLLAWLLAVVYKVLFEDWNYLHWHTYTTNLPMSDLPDKPWTLLATGSVEPWGYDALVAHCIHLTAATFQVHKVGTVIECMRDITIGVSSSGSMEQTKLIAALRNSGHAFATDLVLRTFCGVVVLPWWSPVHGKWIEVICSALPGLRVRVWRRLVENAWACLLAGDYPERVVSAFMGMDTEQPLPIELRSDHGFCRALDSLMWKLLETISAPDLNAVKLHAIRALIA